MNIQEDSLLGKQSSLQSDLNLDLYPISAFLLCLAFDFSSMIYEDDIYAIDEGFMMIYSKSHEV